MAVKRKNHVWVIECRKPGGKWRIDWLNIKATRSELDQRVEEWDTWGLRDKFRVTRYDAVR